MVEITNLHNHTTITCYYLQSVNKVLKSSRVFFFIKTKVSKQIENVYYIPVS